MTRVVALYSFNLSAKVMSCINIQANKADFEIFIFIGGCSLNCTEDDLKSYCSSIGVTPKACTNLETKASWYTAFKITVAEAERDKLMSPDLWPEGIFLRKFYAPRGQRMSGNVNL